MIRTALILIALFSITAMGDGPATQPQLEAKVKWPNPYSYRIGAGIQGLSSGSTDVVIAEVIKTQPRKSLEGAMDNAELKVVRVLMGRAVPEEILHLNYSLLWTDELGGAIEPAKFELGKRYVVFLNSGFLVDLEHHSSVFYELSDPRLSVMPVRPQLIDEIQAAIRIAHGDARGAWSNAVGPFAGRLVAYRTERANNTQVIRVFLDLRNGTGGGNTSELDLSRANFTWNVTDEDGKTIAPVTPLGDEKTPPANQKPILESGQRTRFAITQVGNTVYSDRSGYINLGGGKVWHFKQGEKRVYLAGKIEIPATGEKGMWYGTLELPQVEIPID